MFFEYIFKTKLLTYIDGFATHFLEKHLVVLTTKKLLNRNSFIKIVFDKAAN